MAAVNQEVMVVSFGPESQKIASVSA